MKHCSCGVPATHQTAAGHVLRGGRWRRAYLWECAECSAESDYEREVARSR